MTDEQIKAMQERIEARRAICRRVLGKNYAHHPANFVQRKDAPAREVTMALMAHLAHMTHLAENA
jgi:hypothetical protein